MKYWKFLLVFILGCSSEEKQNCFADTISRKASDHYQNGLEYKVQSRPSYPWEEGRTESLSKITKEFFRCKGSLQNPRIENIFDCEGGSKHSLPIIHGREGVYPILLDLLNYIQAKTKRRVIITSGHKCPIHNTYSDNSARNNASKHMIGAEVDFYVSGMEEKPQEIINLIFKFYKETPGYKDNEDFVKFVRYDTGNTDVSTLPWYNKEIFVKLYKKKEGRDFDNRHSFPYISIQVRYDRDLKERVVYRNEKANSYETDVH